MPKKTYFLKLVPPRLSFMLDMDDGERAIMTAHVNYWKPYVQSAIMIALGPVFTPDGGFGVGIIQVEDETFLQELITNDPANGLCHYEIYPMRVSSKLIVD